MMTFRQHESGVWVYPRSVWRRFIWRLPLLLWPMGLGWLLRPLPPLVLTTRGKKTGSPRRVMIEHGFLNGKICVFPDGASVRNGIGTLPPTRTSPCNAEPRRSPLSVPITDKSELTAIVQHFRNTSPTFKSPKSIRE